MNDEQAVNVAEIASILRIHPQTVYGKAVNAAERPAEWGEIPGLRIGRTWRFFPSAVMEHLRTAVPPIQSAQSRGRKRKP